MQSRARLVTGPVNADELQIASLGIPEGTPVVDERTGKQWRFAAGAENDKWFGLKADPAAGGPAAR